MHEIKIGIKIFLRFFIFFIVAVIVIACGATIGILWSRIKRKVKNRKNKGSSDISSDKVIL